MGQKEILRTGKGQENDEKCEILVPTCGVMGRLSDILYVGMIGSITSRVGIADMHFVILTFPFKVVRTKCLVRRAFVIRF